MKMTIITLQEDINAYGVRCLSSALRARGHETRLVFLGKMSRSQGNVTLWSQDALDYGPRALEQLVDLCADSDLIGFSLMTLYFKDTARISDLLRARLNKPIVWGGIHPTSCPEECLSHADILCLGEAEETIVDVAERFDSLESVPGLWFKRDGGTVRTPRRLPPEDLDALPHPDNSCVEHYVHHDGEIRPLTRELFVSRLGGHYMTINARGCPLRCTYCCNSLLGAKFKWTSVRAKSVPRIIDELKEVTAAYPEIDGIKFSDDAFGDLPLEYICEFSGAYGREIGLPLGIPGFSPMNLTEEKLTPLIDAGLVYIRLGIQSGSARVRKLYGRPDTNAQIVNAVLLVNKYRDRIRRFKLDVITDNPWETEEDVIETIRLLLQLPKPYVLALFSLTFLPATPLYHKAKREGLLSDEDGMVYRKHFYGVDRRSALNRILALFAKPEVLPEKIEGLLAAYRDPETFERRLSEYLEELALRAQPQPAEHW